MGCASTYPVKCRELFSKYIRFTHTKLSINSFISVIFQFNVSLYRNSHIKLLIFQLILPLLWLAFAEILTVSTDNYRAHIAEVLLRQLIKHKRYSYLNPFSNASLVNSSAIVLKFWQYIKEIKRSKYDEFHKDKFKDNAAR